MIFTVQCREKCSKYGSGASTVHLQSVGSRQSAVHCNLQWKVQCTLLVPGWFNDVIAVRPSSDLYLSNYVTLCKCEHIIVAYFINCLTTHCQNRLTGKWENYTTVWHKISSGKHQLCVSLFSNNPNTHSFITLFTHPHLNPHSHIHSLPLSYHD